MRGQARDYDHWGRADGWRTRAGAGTTACRCFLRHEDFHWAPTRCTPRPASTQRRSGQAASGGSRSSACAGTCSTPSRQAAQQAGIPATSDFNRGDNEGVGYFEVNQRRGVRWNATKAFLRPVLRRAQPRGVDRRADHARAARGAGRTARCAARGVEVRTHAVRRRQALRAREVLLARGRDRHAADPAALGHRARPRCCAARHRRRARAARRRREPAGPPADPRRLPGRGREDAQHAWRSSLVGQGADRPGIRAAAQRADEHGAVAAGRLHAQRRRPGACRTSSTTCSRSRSTPSASRCIAFNAFTASVCNLNPTSRGRVRITSADAAGRAAHRAATTSSTDDDRLVAADCLRLTRRIVAQPALARYKPREFKPGVQFQTDDDLARLAGDIGTTIFHPVGTAKMGRADDPLAVVDAQLRVHGVARPARRRRERDAHHHQRQHQRADADDRRACGSETDPRAQLSRARRARCRRTNRLSSLIASARQTSPSAGLRARAGAPRRAGRRAVLRCGASARRSSWRCSAASRAAVAGRPARTPPDRRRRHRRSSPSRRAPHRCRRSCASAPPSAMSAAPRGRQTRRGRRCTASNTSCTASSASIGSRSRRWAKRTR